jgi:hypothetical protein
MRIKFIVDDQPPKKHGEKSMWAQSTEAMRIVSLRKAALKARQEAGLTEPFSSLVAMEVHVFLPKAQLKSIGDLDSLVAGVCDGLQAADPKVIPCLDKSLSVLRGEADPRKPLLITNDANVVLILARKIAFKESKKYRYEVAVEEVGYDAIEKAE